METILLKVLFLAPPILFALTLHEFAHGYVAYRFGDPTARAAGRLTLNPVKHLDPIGTLAFFFINIGWARPVPVNPAYFRNPKKDMLWVALAGPVTNLVLAVISAILAKGVALATIFFPENNLILFNLGVFYEILKASVWINLVLCIFNFLPIPPLDGSRILTGILPTEMARSYLKYERYGFILILLLAFSGLLSKIILPVIDFANTLLLT
ncbi:site-2 protease family protein [Desulfopila sp. IMCC35008]|uniref:site-2 protease family protein n=1 Tax=Desulfopila sp. IMCC35008 TaxID=2653858 RepID=UPI0013D31AA3|nr:site-2 protease family protein [Desulfopila sp. IMCC35008]